MKPRLLDLFCGAGGAAVGYHRAGFDVVGVDHVDQPRYPFAFTRADALNVFDPSFWVLGGLGDFAAIHASPPCQRWSSKTRDPAAHPDLITPIRALLELTGLPYVIENVPKAPLEGPILCGSSFGLGVQRHRRFETNWPLLVSPCAHEAQPRRYPVYDHGRHYTSRVAPVYGTGGGKARDDWAEAMGVDWMTDPELAEAIPPAYTELIGHQLMSHLKAVAA